MLKSFLELNPSIEKETETEHINLKGLWSDSSFMCRFEKGINFTPLKEVYLPPELSAIYHSGEKKLEVIYAPFSPEVPFLNRNFKINIGSKSFECSFSKCSETLQFFATGFKEIENQSKTFYRNLRYFRDYFKPESAPKGAAKFFEGKIPISFWIEGDFDDGQTDFIDLVKHINFYMKFFDRKSSEILIFLPDEKEKDFELPCFNKKDNFPKEINGRNINPVILDLLQIASDTSNVRLKYIFYYQILEYCAYYNLNEDLKRKLNNIIRKPDLIDKSDIYSNLIVEEFKNYFKANDDKQKLEILINEYVDYDDIKEEINCNMKYFTETLEFDGGLNIKPILKEGSDLDNPPRDIIDSIIKRVSNIRNALVHMRESRENKVILPSKKNNHLLLPYLYLIRRLSENVAIKYD